VPGFLSPLRIEEIDGDDRRWRLIDKCIYHLTDADGPEWVCVEPNFVTDFGSIPRLLWGVRGLSPFGRLRRAYVTHDQLYQKPCVQTATGTRPVTRKEADLILLEGCHVLGASWLNRRVIYRGVRMWGWVTWWRYRRSEAQTGSPVEPVPDKGR
jgi:hypothetical protein